LHALHQPPFELRPENEIPRDDSYFVLPLACEQVVTRKIVRLHSHPAPSSGSDTVYGRPKAIAAAATTIATAAIASVLDIRKMNFMRLLDMRLKL
jgi:hypothetical protein